MCARRRRAAKTTILQCRQVVIMGKKVSPWLAWVTARSQCRLPAPAHASAPPLPTRDDPNKLVAPLPPRARSTPAQPDSPSRHHSSPHACSLRTAATARRPRGRDQGGRSKRRRKLMTHSLIWRGGGLCWLGDATASLCGGRPWRRYGSVRAEDREETGRTREPEAAVHMQTLQNYRGDIYF